MVGCISRDGARIVRRAGEALLLHEQLLGGLGAKARTDGALGMAIDLQFTEGHIA
jgi:hypothetical protein